MNGRSTVEAKTAQPRRRNKRIEEVVEFAVSHRIRSQVLKVLHDGTYTAAEIAEMIGEPLNNVANHIRKMHEAGSIELEKAEPRANSNVIRHFYRTVDLDRLRRRAF